MIQGIIFDCYGVLVHGSLQYLRSITPDENRQAFSDVTRASDYGYISQTEYIEQASSLIGRSVAEIEAIIRNQEVRSDEMVKFVVSFRTRFKTALLSNVGRDMVNRLFTPDELKDLFDDVVLSSEVGMAKPNAEIYQYTAAQLGVKPQECIMIDDTPRNVEGAIQVGMRGILFEDSKQCGRAIDEIVRS